MHVIRKVDATTARAVFGSFFYKPHECTKDDTTILTAYKHTSVVFESDRRSFDHDSVL